MTPKKLTTVADLANNISEKAFQNKVIDLARLNGWPLIYHTYDSRFSEEGFLDLVFVPIYNTLH